MYYLAAGIVLFVVGQSLFFLIKAWKQGVKLGISKDTLRDTVTSSALFTVAPALAILATVITLAGALGLVLPWVRLSVIGNLTYEATAASAAMESLGLPPGLAEVTSPKAFAAIAWVMTIGSVFPLVLLPILLKPLQKKIGKVTGGISRKLQDTLSSAAFIGLISVFVGRAIIGSGDATVQGDGAGVMSVLVLASAILLVGIFQLICKKFKLKRLEHFIMPGAMLGAMALAILFAEVLPESLVLYEWRY